MHDPEMQFEELPDTLVARLERADRSQAIVDPRTDSAVIDDARRYFLTARPRRARQAVMRWALPLAAAAALLVAVLVLRPFGLQRPADESTARAASTSSTCSRSRARRRISERRCARGADRLARRATERPVRARSLSSRWSPRPRSWRASRSSRSSGPRRALRWSTCMSTPRCRSQRGSSSCTSGTARCRSWVSRTARAAPTRKRRTTTARPWIAAPPTASSLRASA